MLGLSMKEQTSINIRKRHVSIFLDLSAYLEDDGNHMEVSVRSQRHLNQQGIESPPW